MRSAALEGLSLSPERSSVDILVRLLDSVKILESEIIDALSKKTDSQSLIILVEYFSNSDSSLKDKFVEVFSAMDESGEENLVGLLRQENPEWKTFLAEIFDRTGYIDVLIRQLGHRKPEIRRESVSLLAAIASESAYRGIVLASRDPDRELRIEVSKAIEKLSEHANQGILESLESDPDRKVCQYARWAMERLKAKSIP